MEGCLYVSILCHLGMGIADPEKIWSVICMVGADIYLLQILRKLNIEDRKECGEFFLKNNRYGMLIFLSLLLTNVIDWGKKKIIKEDPDSWSCFVIYMIMFYRIIIIITIVFILFYELPSLTTNDSILWVYEAPLHQSNLVPISVSQLIL